MNLQKNSGNLEPGKKWEEIKRALKANVENLPRNILNLHCLGSIIPKNGLEVGK